MTNLNKTLALVFGVVFLAIGVIGFAINPTLIVFGVNGLHNLVHIASGIALLAGALVANGRHARQVNLVFGVVYLVVALLGFVTPGLTANLLESDSDAFPFADAILHTFLGLVLVGVALATRDHTHSTSRGRAIR